MALLRRLEPVPTGREVHGVCLHYGPGKGRDPEHVTLGLKPGQLFLQLGPTFRERPIEAGEVGLRNPFIHVEAIETASFALDLLQLGLGSGDQSLGVPYLFVRRFGMGS